MTVSKDKTKLPYDVRLEFLDEWLGRPAKRDRRRRLGARDRPPPGQGVGPNELAFQAYSVRITAGDTIWTTDDRDKDALPWCEVGEWDLKSNASPFDDIAEIIDAMVDGSKKIPTRDMDCRWQC